MTPLDDVEMRSTERGRDRVYFVTTTNAPNLLREHLIELRIVWGPRGHVAQQKRRIEAFATIEALERRRRFLLLRRWRNGYRFSGGAELVQHAEHALFVPRDRTCAACCARLLKRERVTCDRCAGVALERRRAS